MKHFFFYLLFSFPILSFAQNRTFDAYYISLDGKKIPCKMGIPNIGVNLQEIKALSNSTSRGFVINSENSLGFGIPQKKLHYKLKQTDLNLTSTGSENPKWDIKENQSLFVSVIAEGELNLYSLSTEKDPYFFIGQGDSKNIEQLIYHSYNNGHSMVHLDKYIDQIYQAIEKDYKVHSAIQYNETEIKKVILILNNMRDESKIKLVERKISLGLNYNLPHLVKTRTTFVEFGSAISPTLDFQFVFPFNKKKPSTSFLTGFNYQYLKLNKSEANSSIFDLSGFSISNFYPYVGLHQRFLSKSKIKPYLSAFIGFNNAHFGTIYFDESESLRMSEASELKGDFIVNSFAIRYSASAGLKVGNNYGVEVRYDNMNNYNDRSKFSGSSRYTQLGFYLSYYLD